MAKPTSDPTATLGDLGESRVLEEVVLPLARRFDSATRVGDDCTFVRVAEQLLAVTADVGPRPLVQELRGYAGDYKAAGWHAAVATASDIATTGARPLVMTNTIDAPAGLSVAALEAFMEGYFSACVEFGFRNGGGDIRQGPSLAARVFGVGVVEHGTPIGRSGAVPGDPLVLIGRAGSFIAAYLAAERAALGPLDKELEDTLRFPRVQLRAMRVLAKHGLVSAASDSSDGVLGAIQNLARPSGCAFHLDLQEELLSRDVVTEAHAGGYNPWNLFFFWGDWSVIVAVPQARFEEFQRVAAQQGIQWVPLGHAIQGPCHVEATIDGKRVLVRPLRNENFVDRGFNTGIKAHVEHMLTTSIFAS